MNKASYLIIPFVLFGLLSAQRQPLCLLGCNCPQKGQNFVLLDCSRRLIKKLPTSLHLDAPLTSVTFQRNQIESVFANTFSEADGVEELDFSQNSIARIDNSTFQPFRNLVLLRLSHNRLSEVLPGLLFGLTNLRVLEIGHNAIQRISSAAFKEAFQIQELRLQYNPIFDLSDNLFEYLPHLEKLDLQETGLVRLPSNLFKPTPRLQWLSLSNNAFESVPEKSLSGAASLESLDLSGNDFSLLVQGDFRRLSKVSLLYLNNLPRLTRIEKDALAGLRSLKSFSCSFNSRLTYVDQHAFGSKNSFSSSPKQLYLRQNSLRSLKSPLETGNWSSLSYVDLADNPWKCDCNLLWMKELPMETQMNIVCQSPPKLQGHSLGSMDSSELECGYDWSLPSMILVLSCIAVFCIILLAVSISVCSRSPAAFFIVVIMAADIATQIPSAGFKFDNCLRNALLTSKGFPAPKAKKTGTTIVGMIYRDGVILGADTRATSGNIVADKNCEKIHYMAPNIYCCGAGTAADTEQVTGMIASQLELHRLSTDRIVPVCVANRLIYQYLFRYQGNVGAALLVGGVDEKGPAIYSVHPHGSYQKAPYDCMGSGSLAAIAVFEKGWKPDLSLDEGKQLVRDAIAAGIFNDLGSGSHVDMCIINKDGAEYIRPYEVSNQKGQILGKYNYPPGTIRVLSSTIAPIPLEIETTVKATEDAMEVES